MPAIEIRARERFINLAVSMLIRWKIPGQGGLPRIHLAEEAKQGPTGMLLLYLEDG
jgi:hypothetical protein